MAITDLEGSSYSGLSLVEAGHVAQFVDVTGDHRDRWVTVAPPSYAAVLLFSVAPSFLWSDAVGEYSKILMHADQSFTFEQPIAVNEPITTDAVVDRIRIRNGVAWVTFVATMTSEAGLVATSKSTFIMSDGQPPADTDEESEPNPMVRASNESLTGATLSIQKSASRQDLVRYAAVSGDFNPLHWDHATARGAGLPRVVGHGLLSASWALQLAASHGLGDRPIVQAKLRFKAPLLPGTQASVRADVDGDAVAVTVTAEDETCVTANVTVTL